MICLDVPAFYYYFYHLLFSALSLESVLQRDSILCFPTALCIWQPWVLLYFSCYPVPVSYTAKGGTSSLAKYYKKRFLRILIPFLYFTLLISCFSFSRAIPSTIFFLEGIPAWRIVLLFLEWIPGSACTTQHLFPYHRRMVSGCLILLYLIFPLLRFL